MDRMLIIAPPTALASTACVVAPTPYGVGIGVAPPLPVVVEFGSEPYYYQGGYHCYYDRDHWRYSNSRSGPWSDLLRSHYPKETRYKGPPGSYGGGQGPDRRGRD